MFIGSLKPKVDLSEARVRSNNIVTTNFKYPVYRKH